jgi:hypothetical protein
MNHPIGINRWSDWDDRDCDYESRCQAVANRYGCGYFATQEPETWYPHPSIQPGSLEGWVRSTFDVPAFAMEGGRDPITQAGRSDSVSRDQMHHCCFNHASGLAAALRA